MFAETVHRSVGPDLRKENFPQGTVVHIRKGAGDDEQFPYFVTFPAGGVDIGAPTLIRGKASAFLERLNCPLDCIAGTVVFLAELVA